MSASFTLKSTVKTFEVKTETGEVLKTFSVDVGNYEELENWYAQSDKVKELASRVDDKDYSEETIKSMRDLLSESVTMILGADAWSWIWEQTNHNVFVCLSFMTAIRGFIKDQISSIQSSYV